MLNHRESSRCGPWKRRYAVKLRFILPALGLLFLIEGAGPAGEGGKEYVWKEGKCSFLLPGKPVEKKGLLQLTSGAVAYLALYADLPESVKVDEASTKQLLKSSRDMLIKSLKGAKLLSDKAIKLGDHPGRELKFDTEPKNVYWTRLYQAGRRYYQLIVLGPREEATAKAAEKFFGSFKLLK
jgi:hypothetical protein